MATRVLDDDHRDRRVPQRVIGQTLVGYTLRKSHIDDDLGSFGTVEEAKVHAQIHAGYTVITPKLDRMFRSALDALGVLAKLRNDGISLHMIDLGGDVTGNGISKLVFTILSAVAEAERDRTRERITEVKRDQKQRGRFLGGIAPFGYRKGDNGELVPIPELQAAIKRMKALRKKGKSLRAISEALTSDGIAVSHVGVANALEAAP